MGYVYKYVYDGEIIYIGKAKDLENRIAQHGRSGDNIPECGWDEINNSEIYFIRTINSTMTDVIESELIRRHKPKYNKAKTSEWCGIEFVEPDWIRYDDGPAIIKKLSKENELLKRQLKKANDELNKKIDEHDQLNEYKSRCYELQIERHNLNQRIEVLETRVNQYADEQRWQINEAIEERVSGIDESVMDRSKNCPYTLEEIVKMFHKGKDVDYTRITKNNFNEVVMVTRIYKNAYGDLKMFHSEIGQDDKNINIRSMDYDGYINYQLMRTKLNKGVNMFYETK